MINTFKKSLSVFLCFVFLIGTVAAGTGGFAELLDAISIKASAEDATSGTCGENVTWNYNDSTKTLTIGGTGAMSDFNWDFYNYNNVTSAPWQPYYNTMQTVVIQSGVTSIGKSAFYGCTGLTSVTIGNGVTSIGDYAFYLCDELTSITIPAGINIIGDDAFRGCSGLTSITVATGNPVYHSAGNCLIKTESKKLILGCNNSVIPNDGSVTSIGSSAFFSCTGLTSADIPNSVTSIGGWAFWNCIRLESITIPDSVTSIGNRAFYNTGYYNTESNWENDVLYIGNHLIEAKNTLSGAYSIKSGTLCIDERAFYECTGLTSISIGNSVTSIGDSAFEGCTGLTSVTIPDSVTRIGNWAFCNCTGLTSITVASGNSVYHSAGNCLIETESKTLVLGCKNSVIPDDGSVTSIGDWAFYGCTGLTNVTVPDSVSNIGNVAFYDCTGLTSVTIGNSVTSIGDWAFYGCTGLTSVDIPDSVTSIGEFAFDGCTRLTSITIGNSVTSIGYAAFFECTELSDVYFQGTEEKWNAILIRVGNDNLLNATIHFQSDKSSYTIKDSSTGISLIMSEELEEIPVLSVVEVTNNYDILVTGNRQSRAYDIKITVNGREIQPSGKVTVKIPQELGFGQARTKIYHIDSETKVMYNMNAVFENGYMVFETDHFSYYAIVEEDSDASVKLNVKSSASVDYRANVTITATATGVPEGYVLAVYDGNTKIAEGENTKVSKNVGNMTANKTYTVKVIDASGNVQKDSSGNDLAANCEVKVNTGFFAKLVAFFRGIFGALPNVEIKP